MRTGGGDDDIHLGEVLGHVFKSNGAALELLRQLLPARQRAVGHQNFINARLQQVHGGQLGHFTSAHQHGLVGFHVAKNALGQFHRGIADGNRA